MTNKKTILTLTLSSKKEKGILFIRELEFPHDSMVRVTGIPRRGKFQFPHQRKRILDANDSNVFE